MKNIKDITIRLTTENDFNIIAEVEEKAFGSIKEAEFTLDLLQDKTALPLISLLAYDGDKAVGHILFTRAYLDSMENDSPSMQILAPLAVIPEYQRQGIGGELIRDGLRRLREWGTKMVFVLGHIEYYPKHGFICDANKAGYISPFPIPEEVADAWMYQYLVPEESFREKGKIICAEAMNKPEHWRE